jgi:hypothetical protein
MTPWVMVALLAGLALGWVGRSVRAAGREWNLRSLLADAEVEAVTAIFQLKQTQRRADAGYQGGYDTGFADGVGIRVDLGEVEP